MRALIIIIVLVVLLAGAFLAFMYSGQYNVAAADGHSAFFAWVLDTTMTNSVKAHAEEVTPQPLDDPSLVKGGYTKYKGSCVICHGSPTERRSPIGMGLTPAPNNLMATATEWSPEEVFWIVKNGIKMTGMPAFGPTHEDKELWGVVALVKELPTMTVEEYKALEGVAARR